MIIITGGAGFIGSALTWRLNDAGISDIMIVDRLGSGQKWQNLAKRRLTTLMHKDDFLPWFESNAMRLNVDAVFHLGASSSTTETDCDYLVRNNLHYSQRLFGLCADFRIPFIYASSAATYGAGHSGYDDDPELVPLLRPLNPYGFSKHIFDTWVLKQTAQPPFWAGLKFFNVYGPNEYHKGGQTSVVYQVVPQVKETGQIKLFKSYKAGIGHGEQKRDFVYVKDCVEVMLHLLNHVGRAQSGIYNLGTGEARSFADLARAVFYAMGYGTANLSWVEMPEQLRTQYQYFTEARMQRLFTQTGYDRPMTRLSEGVQDYVQNYLLKDDPYL